MSGSRPIGEIRLSLQLASVDLDRAITEPGGAASSDLHAASHAVHCALVALDRVDTPAYWRPPRVVGLTLDEAVVTMGVIVVLTDGAAPPWIAPLARSSIERLRARVAVAGELGSDGWVEVL
jgi:hypothetical protein